MKDFTLPKIPRRNSQGRKKKNPSQIRRTNAFFRDSEEQMHVLEIRCKLLGLRATEENLRLVKHQCAGCEAGRAVFFEHDRDDLWGAICEIFRARAAYYGIIGKSAYPKSTNITVLPDDWGNEEAPRPELTDEERAARDRLITAHWLEVYRNMSIATSSHQERLMSPIFNDTHPCPKFVMCLREYIRASDPQPKGRDPPS